MIICEGVITLLHLLSHLNYYVPPVGTVDVSVRVFLLGKKKEMLIMPLTRGSSVASAPFSTLHREVFFSSIFCFEELLNSALVCYVLIFTVVNTLLKKCVTLAACCCLFLFKVKLTVCALGETSGVLCLKILKGAAQRMATCFLRVHA